MKKQIDTIGKIVKNIPGEMYAAREHNKPISGEDLILSGTNEIDGKSVDPKKTYYMKIPVYVEKNHKRRAVRAYRKRGIEGLFSYLQPFLLPEKADDYKQKLIKALS